MPPASSNFLEVLLSPLGENPLLIFLQPYLLIVWQFIKAWWWLVLPFILWKYFIFLWLFWRNDLWSKTWKSVILEVRMPKEVIKPIRAMEQVFAGIHALHDVVTWREKWIEGQYQQSVGLEIASIGGNIHFFIRTPQSFRQVLESNIYSQYPEAEIKEVEDYTKFVPADIPNKQWDLFGFDMINTKPNPYPIKTYDKFETEREALEEKRLDPLAGLLEGMATLKKGEQIWVQVLAKPIRTEIPWIEEGRALVDQLVHREKAEKPRNLILTDAANILIYGKPPTQMEEEAREVLPPEMKLTPGEKDTVQGIEEKITKFGFNCTVRFLYLAEKDLFFKGRARIPMSLYKAVSYEELGGLKPWKVTQPKVKTVFLWFLDKRRAYLRKRRIFRRYYKRYTPLFPRSGGTFILNTMELATLYHFPTHPAAPAPNLSRIEIKKAEAPPDLPM